MVDDAGCEQAARESIAMATGDYVLSFTDQTRELRQPLSNVFRRIWSVQPEPHNNGLNNSCHNGTADSFISETFTGARFV
jgi:hypothetical protein